MLLRVSLLILLLGCNVSFAGLFSDSNARERIDVLDQQMQAMEARIVGIEDILKNQALLELYSQIEAFRVELGQLRGQIEVLNEENKLLKKQQKDFYIDLDSRLRQVEPESHEPSLSLSSSPDETLPPAAVGVVVSPSAQQAPAAATQPASEAEREAYHASYNLFREGDYTGAITQFENFLKRYPNSQLAPGAAYWIGNAYYALRDFGAAINAQQIVIENYPNSSKAPDAMLNIASNQAEMGEISAAKKTLENLIAKYPNSDAAGKAKSRLANLR